MRRRRRAGFSGFGGGAGSAGRWRGSSRSSPGQVPKVTGDFRAQGDGPGDRLAGKEGTAAAGEVFHDDLLADAQPGVLRAHPLEIDDDLAGFVAPDDVFAGFEAEAGQHHRVMGEGKLHGLERHRSRSQSAGRGGERGAEAGTSILV